MSLKITNNIHMFVIFKAIELASKGFDISHTDYGKIKSTWWNAKTKSFQERMSDNVPEVYLELLPDAEEIFPYLYNNKIKRNRDKKWETIEDFPEDCEKIHLNAASIKQTMKFLRDCGAFYFSGIDRIKYDDEYLDNLRKLDDDYKPEQISEQLVSDLSRDNTRKEFRAMAALAYKDNPNSTELMTKLQEAFDNDADFSQLPEDLHKYKIIDNRMYIPIKKSWVQMFKDERYSPIDDDEGLYFVLSKNLYDFFYCSYGSSFQSCFALNSCHGGWQGAVINDLHKSCYMLYLTKGHGQKVSLTGEGRKYAAPYMYMRTWCWLCEDGKLHIDKMYASGTDYYNNWLNASLLSEESFTRDSSKIIDVDSFVALQERYKGYWYPDSIRFCAGYMFDYDAGDKCFKGISYRPNFLREWLQRLTSVSDTLDLSKSIVFNEGRLYNPKTCPITGLLIDESQEVSEYAKHFKQPVEGGLIVLTYLDGFIRVDAMSKSYESFRLTNYAFDSSQFPKGVSNTTDRIINSICFSNIETPVDKIKEKLKADLKTDNGFGMILLRVINGGQVTWIKLRKDK